MVTCPQCVQRTLVPVESEAVGFQSAPPAQSTSTTESAHGLVVGEDKNWLTNRPKPTASFSSVDHDEDEDEDDEGFELKRSQLPHQPMDMTPMVDVVMLLLIFFMITASFATQKSLETTPPEAEGDGIGRVESSDEPQNDSIVVQIDENDIITVDQVQVSGISDLRDVLTAQIQTRNTRDMVIEAHPQAKHGTVVTVMDAGLSVEMQRIRRTSTAAN
ncbi:ExbD/TolR family protein [Planctomicrobium sp. SH527]|uniref:ExbD/TolR family protein n=1 Tax=Planctomicrobium sp. SH527 TaxID=3448123 RepID=UPI003F5C029D